MITKQALAGIPESADPARPAFLSAFNVGKECGEDADERQEGADIVDVFDARMVGIEAKQGGAETAHSEGKTEKQAGNRPDFSW